MSHLDSIISEAAKLSEQQLREALAMATGMDAANKLQGREEERR